MPRRIQRKRTKGWRMPPGAIYVGRPGPFGNPIEVNERCTAKESVIAFRKMLKASQSKLAAMMVYEDRSPAPIAGLAIIVWRQTLLRRLPELRGKDLACWCALDQPCHADVLLEIANR